MEPLQSVLKTLSATLISISVAYAQIPPATYVVLPLETAPISHYEERGLEKEVLTPQRGLEGSVNVLRGVQTTGNAPIRSLITKYAKMYQVSEYTALSIADIESDYVEDAKNPRSSAQGVFQIISGTFKQMGCTGNRLNAEDNVRCALYILGNPETGGIQHWCNPETKRELIKLGIKDCK